MHIRLYIINNTQKCGLVFKMQHITQNDVQYHNRTLH